MATRQSVTDCLNRCQEAISFASDQYTEGCRQESYRDAQYSDALLGLDQSVADLEKLKDSANDQQREMLDRMRIQVQDLQNRMILLDHGVPAYTLH